MAVLYFLFWVLLNGKINLEITLIGIAVTAIVSYFNYKLMGKSFAAEKAMWKKADKIILYFFMLVNEVFLANIYMIEIVLQSKIETKPVLVFFKSPVKTRYGKVALANSITLTPGTITTSLADDYFAVHCIDVGASEGLDSSIFVEKILEIEE